MRSASAKTPVPPPLPVPARTSSRRTPTPFRPMGTPPSDGLNHEVIRGVEMMSPRPARKHTWTEGNLFLELGSRYHGPKGGDPGPGGWIILVEPELHLERDTAVIPDLAGWREERAPEDTDEAAYNTAPDWVCEIQSPSTRAWDREQKMPFYAFHRVGHLWMVDPIAQQLEVFALGRRGWELLGTFSGSEKIRAEPFDDTELSLARIWPRPLPPRTE